jgi:DNA mismatch endonuclease (patch repair protein)
MRTDVFTKAKRSAVMAAIRPRGNKTTEECLVKVLRSARLVGWRRHYPLPRTPDFVFRQPRVVIFVDGCFWHGCPSCYRRPKSRRKYWDGKLAGNIARDRRNRAQLLGMGWHVVRIWEHELATSPAKCVSKIQRKLRRSRSLPARQKKSHTRISSRGCGR